MLSETQAGQRYRAQVAAARPALLLFKMTWHPNWIAYVDGKVQPTAMLSPGFVGVPVAPGAHGVQLAYQPGFWKLEMALAGLAIALTALAAEKRGYLTILGFAAPAAR